MNNKLYNLKCEESCIFGNYHVTRVPGGWVFSSCLNETICFVPYNNEFQNNSEEN